MSLPECEDESLNAGIKELDLKTPVLYLAFLADELVQTRLLNLASAVRGGIRSTIVGRRFAVQRHLEANWLTINGDRIPDVQIAHGVFDVLAVFSKENSGPCSLDDLHVTHCLCNGIQF